MDQNEFNLQTASSLGRIETKLDNLIGPNGKIAVVENRVASLETDRTRNWWFTVIFAPILAALTATLRHFGIHI